MSFNVLTDPWVPLDDGRGLASYVDVLCGERDAPDLVHPRDDFRFFARMLLSALTQALFPVANAKELRARLDRPMPRAEVEKTIAPCRTDFELVGGASPWMQPRAETGEIETRRLLLDLQKHMLFRPVVAPHALCAPCAVLALYGLQSFAPYGGRGYSPGVRGEPPTTTMVVFRDSVRKTVWANVLHAQKASTVVYGAEPASPWRMLSLEKPGESIGLVEGLFWKPWAVTLQSVTPPRSACAACGTRADALVAAVVKARGQRRTGGLYRHPLSPCASGRGKKLHELQFSHLATDRPAWTSLADWLAETAGGDGERKVLPAPVVSQWEEYDELSGAEPKTSLYVLDYGYDQASVVGRFADSFPLSRRIVDREVVASIRECVRDAERSLGALRGACVRVHMKLHAGERLKGPRKTREKDERKRLHDTTATFWQRTEPSFFRFFDALVANEADDALVATHDAFLASLQESALELFDAWASPSFADPSRVAVVAQARTQLARALPRKGALDR